MAPIADLRRYLSSWQLRLLDLGLPLACALAALLFRQELAAGGVLIGAVLVAAALLVRDRWSWARGTRAGAWLRATWLGTGRSRAERPGLPGGPLWRLWLLDAGLALALVLTSVRLRNDVDGSWSGGTALLVAGLLVQRRWPLPAAVVACAGAVAHFYWGAFGILPVDLAAPITVYVLATRTTRRRVAVAAVGMLLAGVYAASLARELTDPSDQPAYQAVRCPPAASPTESKLCLVQGGAPGRTLDRKAPVRMVPPVPRWSDDRPDELSGGLARDRRALAADADAAAAAAKAGHAGDRPRVGYHEPTGRDRLVDALLGAFGNGVLPMLILGLALAFGDGIRSRRAHLHTLEQRAADLEREQHQRTALATAAERARITRELHDVVAHGMSVMVVQAQGGAAALQRHPDRTADALQNVITTGRASLAEMRRLLGVVSRDTTDDPQLAPQPGLCSLPALVDQVRATGTAVRLSIEGRPVPLPASVDLSAYRITQEALTNTIKHAGPGAAATVRLAFAPDWIEIEVTDDGVGERTPMSPDGSPAGGSPADGNGLRGIAERVGMLGGEFAVGPGPGGGFRVWVLLPSHGCAEPWRPDAGG